MTERRRFTQGIPMQDRLAVFLSATLERAALAPTVAERDALLKKARQAETASQMEQWANSPGLQPPK